MESVVLRLEGSPERIFCQKNNLLHKQRSIKRMRMVGILILSRYVAFHFSSQAGDYSFLI